ncbi:MAG TPA: hypothetical protein VKK19_11840 [Candidatus Dormibacteraeota bacterium]|nr:hypothetical protein [Candidatus Dormibacteraeota bacterium]
MCPTFPIPARESGQLGGGFETDPEMEEGWISHEPGPGEDLLDGGPDEAEWEDDIHEGAPDYLSEPAPQLPLRQEWEGPDEWIPVARSDERDVGPVLAEREFEEPGTELPQSALSEYAGIGAEEKLEPGAGLPPGEQEGIVDSFTDMVQRGLVSAAVLAAVVAGERDERTLTNRIFFARHPELGGRKLRPDETSLATEWLQIRDRMVRPLLSGIIKSTFRKPTVGFEFDVHYGLIPELLPSGVSMPLNKTVMSTHSKLVEGFEVQLDGQRLEINTKPFESTGDGKKELREMAARIDTFAAELNSGCQSASEVRVAGISGAARPFLHPRMTMRIAKLPVRGGFDNCSVWAAPQATLTVRLSKIAKLVERIKASEGKGAGVALTGGSGSRMGLQSEAIYRAYREVKRARRASSFSADLEGFLILLASYLWTSELPYRFPTPDAPARPGEDYEPFGKAYLPVNVKTPLSQVFGSLLGAGDQQAFRDQFADGAARVNLFRLARPAGATLTDGNRMFLPTGPMDGGKPSVHELQKAVFRVAPTWNDVVEHTLNSTHRGWGDRLLVPMSTPLDVSKTSPRVLLELRRVGFTAVDRSDWEGFMLRMHSLTDELDR